jgi:hypothetical protein
MSTILWFVTMLFFVGFFSYGYVLWKRSKERKSGHATDDRTDT